MKSNAIIKWADQFIDKLTYDLTSVDFEADTTLIFSNLVLNESRIQDRFERDIESEVYGNPVLLDEFVRVLDLLELRRTRAAEIGAFLGLHEMEHVLMVAVLLKRISTLQPRWKENMLTVSHVDLFFNSATISQETFNKMWLAQKGYNCGFNCENLLHYVEASDFE